MTYETDLGPDDGFASVKIGGVSQTLDIYVVQNCLHEIALKFKDKPNNDYHAAVLEYMESLGYESGMSHRMAVKFITEMSAADAALEKKTDGGAESPDSTASTPENGTTENLRDLIPQ